MPFMGHEKGPLRIVPVQVSELAFFMSAKLVMKENMMKFMLTGLASVLLILFLMVLARFFLVGALLSPTAGRNVFQIRGRPRQLWYGSGSSRYRCRHCRQYRGCEGGENTHV